MWSPQMIGVAPVRLGIGSFQATFSSGDHFTGSPFSLLTPLRRGPRHCGQFSAERPIPVDRPTVKVSASRLLTIAFLQTGIVMQIRPPPCGIRPGRPPQS